MNLLDLEQEIKHLIHEVKCEGKNPEDIKISVQIDHIDEFSDDFSFEWSEDVAINYNTNDNECMLQGFIVYE